MELCETCGQSKAWHEEVKPMHAFVAPGGNTNGGAQLTAPDEPREAPMPASPRGDLVLRLTLLQKGLINEADLRHTEFWIHESLVRAKALEIIPDVENGGLKYALLEFDEVGKPT